QGRRLHRRPAVLSTALSCAGRRWLAPRAPCPHHEEPERRALMAPAIIAVFPAAGRVGIVRRQHDRQPDTLTDHRLLTRAEEPVAFLADVLDELAAMIQPADRI